MGDQGHRYIRSDEQEWSEAPEGLSYVVFSTQRGDPGRPLTALSKYPPNHRVAPHTHGCDYIEIVLEGELRVGKVALSKGDVRIMKAGAGYGPLVSGPAGCKVLTIFDRADGSQIRWLGKEAALQGD